MVSDCWRFQPTSIVTAAAQQPSELTCDSGSTPSIFTSNLTAAAEPRSASPENLVSTDCDVPPVLLETLMLFLPAPDSTFLSASATGFSSTSGFLLFSGS